MTAFHPLRSFAAAAETAEIGRKQSVRFGADGRPKQPLRSATVSPLAIQNGQRNDRGRSVRRTYPVTFRDRSLRFVLQSTVVASQVDAVSRCSGLDCRFASSSGLTSAMAVAPPTSIMTPHMKKPVLNPSSGVVAVSITLPMI